MSLPVDYEPAARDPKRLRRTAWILLAIMLIGGWLVLKSYETWAIRQSKDERPARIHRILKERDLRVIRQDGKTMDLFELRGSVWLVNAVSLENPVASGRSLAVMKRLAGKYAGTAGFKLVSLVVDPPSADALVPTLARHAQTHGMNPPQWWLAGTEAATMHKFIKNELKAGIFPHQENGAWIYDTSLVLLDREGHVRRAVVPQQRGGPPFVAAFDFDQAAQWDREGKKTGTARSNEAELEVLLEKTIAALLAETPESP